MDRTLFIEMFLIVLAIGGVIIALDWFVGFVSGPSIDTLRKTFHDNLKKLGIGSIDNFSEESFEYSFDSNGRRMRFKDMNPRVSKYSPQYTAVLMTKINSNYRLKVNAIQGETRFYKPENGMEKVGFAFSLPKPLSKFHFYSNCPSLTNQLLADSEVVQFLKGLIIKGAIPRIPFEVEKQTVLLRLTRESTLLKPSIQEILKNGELLESLGQAISDVATKIDPTEFQETKERNAEKVQKQYSQDLRNFQNTSIPPLPRKVRIIATFQLWIGGAVGGYGLMNILGIIDAFLNPWKYGLGVLFVIVLVVNAIPAAMVCCAGWMTLRDISRGRLFQKWAFLVTIVATVGIFLYFVFANLFMALLFALPVFLLWGIGPLIILEFDK